MNPQWLMGAPQEKTLLPYAPAEKVEELARLVCDEYDIDKGSTSDWREAMAAGLRLTTGERPDKEYPWKKASNIRYPLVTVSALAFNARAYPAIVPPGDVVKVRVNGRDPGGLKAARAQRVAAHMSYQLRTRVPEWEGETDKLLMQLPVVGVMFRKTWFDAAQNRICSKVCKPGSVIVNDAVGSLAAAPRISEEIALYPNEIISRQRAGLFADGDWWKEGDVDTLAPVEFIEQHRPYDLDGDGYPEPYVVTVHKETRKIVRIAANWAPEEIVATDRVITIPRRDYYQDYHFAPSPSGGFHSMGFGLLLKDISASIDAALNMMFDAEHMASLPGGFLGKEARLKGGRYRLEPGRWEQIAASGADVRAAMVQVSAPGASVTMFNLLGLLIEAGREIANVKDISDIAQRANQPATTTLALIEQGMQTFTAIYQRVHRALTAEFRAIARINVETLDPQEYAQFHDAPVDPRQDYEVASQDIEPVADPRQVTNQQKLGRAQLVMEMATQGLANPQVAAQRIMEAAGIEDTEELLPQPDPRAEKVADMEAEIAEISLRRAMLENAKIAAEIAKLESEVGLVEAQATKAMAEAEAADPLNPVNIARMQIEALKARMKNDTRGTGRMASAPSDASGLEGIAPGGGIPQGGDTGGLLAGLGSGPAQVGAGQGPF